MICTIFTLLSNDNYAQSHSAATLRDSPGPFESTGKELIVWCISILCKLVPNIWYMLGSPSKQDIWFAGNIHFGIVERAWILESDSDLTLKYVICYVTLSLKLHLFGLQFPYLKRGKSLLVCRIFLVLNDDYLFNNIYWVHITCQALHMMPYTQQ